LLASSRASKPRLDEIALPLRLPLGPAAFEQAIVGCAAIGFDEWYLVHLPRLHRRRLISEILSGGESLNRIEAGEGVKPILLIELVGIRTIVS
jgi:hypothetical protein